MDINSPEHFQWSCDWRYHIARYILHFGQRERYHPQKSKHKILDYSKIIEPLQKKRISKIGLFKCFSCLLSMSKRFLRAGKYFHWHSYRTDPNPFLYPTCMRSRTIPLSSRSTGSCTDYRMCSRTRLMVSKAALVYYKIIRFKKRTYYYGTIEVWQRSQWKTSPNTCRHSPNVGKPLLSHGIALDIEQTETRREGNSRWA